MARVHLWGTNGYGIHPLVGWLDGSRHASGGLAHLRFMEPTQTPETTTQTGDAVVISGVFESAVSLQELAEQLHVSAQTIYDLRSQGRGPTGFRVGRQLRFRQAEIEAWLERLEQEDAERPSRARVSLPPCAPSPPDRPMSPSQPYSSPMPG